MNTSVSNDPEYSIIIPIYNEEEVLPSLLPEIVERMDTLGRVYEIVVIDDGSTDGSWNILQSLAAQYRSLEAYRLLRNFGHQKALYSGLHVARGKAIGVMDGDGQDPIEVLMEMFDLWGKGYDVIYGVRKKRKENILKKSSYFIFYRLYRKMANIDIPLDSGDFCVMDRKVVDFIVSLQDSSPFIRGLRSWYGGRQLGLEYHRLARQKGEPKYTLFKLIDLAINGLTSFSKEPLRWAVYFGGAVSVFTFIFLAAIVIGKLCFNYPESSVSAGWASAISLTSFIGGVNIMLLGLIGEYIMHIFESVKHRPAFLIKESTRKDN